jgi:hypothetical protein
MKIGVIYEPWAANSYYRAIIPMRALERRGHTVVWPTEINALPFREFLHCDVVHCYRRIDRIGDLRALSRAGVAVSFDNDDDVSAAEPMNHRIEEFQRLKQIFRETLKASRLADLTTTPSERLAGRYRSAGSSNVVVIGNYLGQKTIGSGAPSKHNDVVVGWIAGREHASDCERVPFVPALEQLLEVHQDVRILTVGVRLPLSGERYEHVPGVPFIELAKAVARIDIGLAPLADTPFNRSRSNVKLKEYGSCGVAWLASPVGPYIGHGEREGGQLVDDRDWFTTLDDLVRSPRQRKRLARSALKWAAEQSIDHHAAQWEQAFEAAIERAAARRVGASRPSEHGAQSR